MHFAYKPHSGNAIHFTRRTDCERHLASPSDGYPVSPWDSIAFEPFDSLLSRFTHFVDALFELKSCDFTFFGDSFFDSCLTIAAADPPTSVTFIARVLLLVLKKCDRFPDYLRQSQLCEYLSQSIADPVVISFFAKLCSSSRQLNREIVQSDLFDAILDLPPSPSQFQFCSHFFRTCDPSDVSSFNRALACLASATDSCPFRFVAKGLCAAIVESRASTVGYLRQVGFFSALCRCMRTTDSPETLQGCLAIVEAATRA
jgi:hypothetical protein